MSQLSEDDKARETYDKLPESVKASITYKQWCWLPPEQKNNIEHCETMVTETYVD